MTLPTPCARDGKGPGHQRGLPDLIERATHATTGLGPATRGPFPPAGAVPGPGPAAGRLLPTPRASDGRGPALHGAGGADLRTAVWLLPTPRASDGAKGCPAQRGSKGDLTLPAAAVTLTNPHRTDTPHTPASTAAESSTPGRAPTAGRSSVDGTGGWMWGRYSQAVARWEQLLGRAAPACTQPGTHGRPVLAPPFVEWLMGLPVGWVTDLGLPRTVALRVLGNGVVPQQAALALRLLLCPHRTPPTTPPRPGGATTPPAVPRRHTGDPGRQRRPGPAAGTRG